MTWPASSPGWLLEPHGDVWPRGMVVHDRTRLIGRLPFFVRNFLFRRSLIGCGRIGFGVFDLVGSGDPWPHFSPKARFDGRSRSPWKSLFWRASFEDPAEAGLQGGSRPKAGSVECVAQEDGSAATRLWPLDARARLARASGHPEKRASRTPVFARMVVQSILEGIVICMAFQSLADHSSKTREVPAHASTQTLTLCPRFATIFP